MDNLDDEFTESELKEIHNLKENFIIESWHDKLKSISIPSYYFGLNLDEAKALFQFNECFTKNQKIEENNYKIIEKIEEKLNIFIKENNLDKKGFFIKLSFRSPKDGYPLDKQKFEKSFLEYQKKYTENMSFDYLNQKLGISFDDYQGNIDWLSFVQSWKDSMKCYSAEEILNFILTSKRAKSDLITEIEYYRRIDKTKDISINLVLREWVDDIDVGMEFRVFIKDNKINAISQYNYPILIASLLFPENQTKIKNNIYNYWKENISDKLSYLSDYVIDFAVVNNDVKFIELNPFKESCGSCLFNWRTDKKLLFGLLRNNSKTDFENIEFRIKSDIEIPYRDYYDGCIEPVKLTLMMIETYKEYFALISKN